MLVAVYGSLKRGLGNYALLRESEFKGGLKTAPEFTMYDLGAFPGIMPNGNTSITCEVFEVDEPTFETLDRLEGYPNFYDRMKIDTEWGEAWIYFLAHDRYRHNDDVIRTGVWEL